MTGCLIPLIRILDQPSIVPSQEKEHLLRLLTNRRLAIVGDSMARQSFATLVSLLSSSRTAGVIDPSSHDNRLGWRRVWHASRSAEFWQVGSTREPTPCVSLRQELLELRSKPHCKWIHLDWIFMPCTNRVNWPVDTDAVHASLVAGNYSIIFVHEPAYWHAMSTCGKVPDLRRAVASFWASLWRTALQARSLMIAVSAPKEHVTDPSQFDPVLTVSEVTRHFNETLSSHANRWMYVDWAQHIRSLNSDTVGGGWHYACTVDKMLSFTQLSSLSFGNRDTNRSEPPLGIRVRQQSGDCFETANTVLWLQLVAPRLQQARRTSFRDV